MLDVLRKLRDDYEAAVVIVTHSGSVAETCDRVVERLGREGGVMAVATAVRPALVHCSCVTVVHGAGRPPSGPSPESTSRS